MSEKQKFKIKVRSIHAKDTGYIYFPASHEVAMYSKRGAMSAKPCERSTEFKDMSYLPEQSLFRKAYISRGAALLAFTDNLNLYGLGPYEFTFLTDGQETKIQANHWYYIEPADFEDEHLINRPCIWQEAYIA